MFQSIASLVSCGGGGSSGEPPPPPPVPDFSIVVVSPSISLQQQGAYQGQILSAKPLNGFNGTINFTLSGLPTDVATIPANIPPLSTTGTIQGSPFQLSASQTTPIGNSTVTVTATSGSITHSATFSLAVTSVAPFVIQASPGAVSLVPDSTQKVQVSVAANPGTTPSLTVTTSSLPPNSGTDLTQLQVFLTPTAPVQLVVQAGVLAQPLLNAPIVITATDNNSANSSVTVLPLTISVPSSNTSPTRSTFARTDQSPTGMVYDQFRKLLFVSVEVLNQVAVFSSVDGHRVTTISVPYPSGIDETADGSAVYVVSPYFPSITTIDPNLLEVVNRTSLPQISGLIQTGFQIAVLSNGRVMILLANQDPNGPPIYLWNPTTNTFEGLGQQSFLSFNTEIMRSADRSRVLITYGSDAFIYSATIGNLSGPLTFGSGALAISPDGSQIVGGAVGLYGGGLAFYDDQANLVGSMALNGPNFKGALYGLDGSHFYFLGNDLYGGGNLVSVIDTKTFSLVGVVPGFGFGTSIPFSGLAATPFAIDETNMIFGGVFQGIGYVDASSPGFFQLPPSVGSLFSPTLVGLTAPTPLEMNGQFSLSQNYNLYFSAPPASPLAEKGTDVSVQSTSVLDVTAPTGSVAGPATATLTRSDGFYQVMPDAVSYGPTVLSVDANAGSPSGGDTVELVGYGLDAASVQVTFGGKSATNLQLRKSFAGSLLPTQTLTLTTPANSPGNADVTITEPAGSTTIPGGFQYLASLQVYPITGALDGIVYDQARQRLYITNADHNRVETFDLGTRTYLSPIAVGNLPSALAITPDDLLLAVLNSADNTISVINLTTNAVAATYAVLTSWDVGCGGQTLNLSPAKPHRVLVNLSCTFALSGGNFHLLDLDTGSLSCTGVAGCDDGVSIGFGEGLAAMASTADGSKIFLAGTGQTDGQTVGMFDLTANTLKTGFTGVFRDAAANVDGNIFAATFGIANAELSRVSIMAYEPYGDSGNMSLHNVTGEKLSPSGSLLFEPQDTGVDVFDVHTGRLAMHIALPESIPPSINALALNETGTKMFLISNSGITIAELFQAPLSLASVSPTTGSQGTLVTVRGSGFQNGATVTFGTLPASMTYVDQNTITATVPMMSTGPVRITVTNPNGHAYSFDAAFTVQ